MDINTLYELGWSTILMMWIKFKPVIMMYRKSDYGEDTYASFERLATEMWRIKVERDPEWMEHDGEDSRRRRSRKHSLRCRCF